MQATKILFVCCLLLTILSLGETSTVSEDIQSNFLDSDLNGWVPPKDFLKNLTYYMSGHDDDGKPIWVWEWGNWNVREYVEEGGEALETLNKYVNKMVLNVLISVETNLTDSDDTPQIIGIVDLEGYSYQQLASASTLSYYLQMFGLFSPLIGKYVKVAYVINANYVAETAINMIRPVLGKAFEVIEVFGTNKAKWLPRLSQNLPKHALPEWYGGDKDFAPLKVFG